MISFSKIFLSFWLCVPFAWNAQVKHSNKFDINQTLSSGAQTNTIAFSAVAFYTGSYYASSFYPPGKVADFFGFQFMRDNDLTKSGHNTDFLTKAAWNTMEILNPQQIQMLVDLAQNQEKLFNDYASGRLPLIYAFHRALANDIPKGKTQLNFNKIDAHLQNLYKIDGEISYGRAISFAKIINSLSQEQINKFHKMDEKGMQDWKMPEKPNIKIPRGLNVWVMSNASEFFSWYLRNSIADVYFCPERHGTYFGGFFMKDAPAVGNKGYAIDTELTANKGAYFLENILSNKQAKPLKDLYPKILPVLNKIVEVRTSISLELRKAIDGNTPDKDKIIQLSALYGSLDAEYNFSLVTAFLNVYKTLSKKQIDELSNLRNLTNFPDKPNKVFFYSKEMDRQDIPDSDSFFK